MTDDDLTPEPAGSPPQGTPSLPPPSWIPPGSSPTYPQASPEAFVPQQTPIREAAAEPVRVRVSGWLWPLVAATALIVGVVGGVGGAVAYERFQTPTQSPGSVSGGLNDVDTVSLPPLTGDDGSIAKVAQELLPSTVQISAQFEGQEGGATGSGFVLDKQGHIITNNHVVADAASSNGPIQIVDQEGNRYDATVVGRSPVYDLAVLYSEDATGLRPAALGASRKLRVGQTVVAFGSPLGLTSTVTSGIVSSLNRPVSTGDTADDSSYINAVQTDAAINPGNSGGPLVNLRGQVVGVNSAIATSGGGTFDQQAGNIGVGFAIPIEQVRVTADEILRTGRASYPVIGAEVQTGGQGNEGALIRKVLEDTPSADAGLQADDLVTAVDGTRVTDGISLIVAIRSNQPGDTLEFSYLRGDEQRTTSITLGSQTG